MPNRAAPWFALIGGGAFSIFALWLVWPFSDHSGDGQLFLAYITVPASFFVVLVSSLSEHYGWSHAVSSAVSSVFLCVVGVIQYSIISYYLGLFVGKLYGLIKS